MENDKVKNFIKTTIRKYLNEQQNNLIKESKQSNTIKVFHGTKPKFVNDIKNNGLIDKSGYNQGWYMVSTDFESALFHAHPDNDNGDVYVIEFEIPNIHRTKRRSTPQLQPKNR